MVCTRCGFVEPSPMRFPSGISRVEIDAPRPVADCPKCGGPVFLPSAHIATDAYGMTLIPRAFSDEDVVRRAVAFLREAKAGNYGRGKFIREGKKAVPELKQFWEKVPKKWKERGEFVAAALDWILRVQGILALGAMALSPARISPTSDSNSSAVSTAESTPTPTPTPTTPPSFPRPPKQIAPAIDAQTRHDREDSDSKRDEKIPTPPPKPGRSQS